MPPTYASSDSKIDSGPLKKLFGRQRPMHKLLGGGKVADLLLWKNINVSASLLAGTTVVWFLFEVVEYTFVTLVSHILITAMLAIFIWRTAAEIFNWDPPKIPKLILDGSAFNEIAFTIHKRLNQLLAKLFDIACGRDLATFLLAIFLLYIMSVIGSCFSFLNLFYLGLLSVETLPFLYNMYENEVDHLAGIMINETRRLYRKFDRQFLNKIPRGPLKEKKRK
ncbi:hypothetical protein SAY87_026573 [Trapa incisa]|uniref:Reticulon-like protein n=1 Tax=Trapa incisa TaxID=236973 RepID=A0AAN7JL58_9MYRT|nr:hypothetical protein SAY87_026573 [Trapa incisa]